MKTRLTRPWRRAWPAAAASAALAVAAATAMLAVSRAEERDPFCISCHIAPEQTYFDRAQLALAQDGPYLDLASAHYGLASNEGSPSFRCIDCHRGDGSLPHRAVTLALGARDLMIFVAGQADQAIEKRRSEVPALHNAACARCHQDSLLVAGFENHFHNKLPAAYAAWRAGGQLVEPPDQPGPATTGLSKYDTSVVCTDCHPSHVHVDGAELQSFLDIENDVFPACVRCHQEVERGPLELAR